MKDAYIGKRIRIKQCRRDRLVFHNLKPNTTHTIIAPPVNSDSINGDFGVWVQGINGVVKLRFAEFTFVNKFKRTLKRTQF